MSLQKQFENFRDNLDLIGNPEAGKCLCGGDGWILSDFDTWHKCPYHFSGQEYPKVSFDELDDLPEEHDYLHEDREAFEAACNPPEPTTFDVRTHNGFITVENTKTGDHRTFKVWASTFKGDDEPKRVVSLLTGPDRDAWGDWQGFGFATEDGARVWRKYNGTLFEKFCKILNDPARGEELGLVYHFEGRCRRCNRALTVPESIESGIGPVCAAKA